MANYEGAIKTINAIAPCGEPVEGKMKADACVCLVPLRKAK